MLPEVVWSSERVGEVTTTLGLGGVDDCGIAGDQQAALFGQLCWSPGEAKNTYGTGCFLLQNIGTEFVRSKHRLITTSRPARERRLEYALEGSIFIGGAVVQWLRDNLRLIGSSAEVEALAASVPDAGGADLCAGLCGFGRAALGSACGRTLIGSAARHAARPHCAGGAREHCLPGGRRAGSGAQRNRRAAGARCVWMAARRSNDLLMQFQADLLGVPVVRPRVTETTALGAAYLAGLAVGFWHSPEDLKSNAQATCVSSRE